MPETADGKATTSIISVALGVLALPLWALTVAGLTSLSGSDAAGNAMSQGFTALFVIALWIMLAILAIVAYLAKRWPIAAALAALVLVPASGVVTMEALGLLSRPHLAPYYWPIVIPTLAPLLIITFCLWSAIPSARAAIPAAYAGGFTWGLVFILCVAIWPLDRQRAQVYQQQADVAAKFDADYARLPDKPTLWELVPFLEHPNKVNADAVLERMRHLDRRQSDAELMLDRGDFPLAYLGRIDLEPTPAICDKARGLLRRRVAPLVLQTPGAKPYSDIAEEVGGAVAAMSWLVGYDCGTDAESLAWETMAKAYQGANYDVYELAHLRDPQQLGRVLRYYPERYAMLTPKAHLSAWLKFADEKEYRDQALAGARKLEHRNADAIEMLADRNNIAAPWTVLKYLPVLDLEATASLCTGALNQVRADLAKVYRPKSDDPRSYDELLSRLGTYRPLTALVWLADHGCDAAAEVSDAEAVVRAYQTSPDGAAMLATLARLHRRP